MANLRFRRPTFLRTLSTSIRNRGAHGSLPLRSISNEKDPESEDVADNFSGKVNLEAGVLEVFFSLLQSLL